MKKLYYSIGEVSKLLDIEQHILRYWDKEISLLKTKKNRAGNRVYSAEDIEFLKLIKNLIDEKKLSLKQANKLFEIYKSKSEIIKNYDNIVKGVKIESKPGRVNKDEKENTKNLSLSQDTKTTIKKLLDEIIDILNS